MALWVNVIGFSNGEYVNDTTLNRPVRELRERTDYLYGRFQDALGSAEFESLRLVDVPLTTGTDAEPSIKDFVYLNPTTKTYEKAVASVSVVGNVFQMATAQAYSLGVLVAKSGGLGTIVVYGRLYLRDTTDWDLSTMLETGETFQSGPYYLSPSEAGKMTSNPRNIAIYLGYFVDTIQTPGVGGYAVIGPQYKDVGEAHMHRAFPLAGHVAGSQEIVGTIPNNATHKLHGFLPKSADVTFHGTHNGIAGNVLIDTIAAFTLDNYINLVVTNVTAAADSARSMGTTQSIITANDMTSIWTVDPISWLPNDEYYISPRCRIVVTGQYSGISDTTYTLTLTNSTGAVGAGIGGPVNGTLGFEDVYLTWSSSDPIEDSGITRITSYEVPIPFGTKGLSAILENVLEEYTGAQQWNYAEGGSESLLRRQWEISAPSQVKGWRARRFRQTFADHVTVDGKCSLVLLGGPFINPYLADRSEQLVTDCTAIMVRLYQLDYTAVPLDGDTVTIGVTTYEFDDDGVYGANNIPVTIDAYSEEACYVALLTAILERNDPLVHVAIDKLNARLMIGVRPVDSVALSGGYTGGTLTLTYNGADGLLYGGPDVTLLLYDDAYEALVPVDSCWAHVALYTPITLNNNLRVMFIPYDTDRVPATGYDVTAEDNWTTSIIDEAPNALFEYSLDMEQTLRRYYPPVPLSAASLIVNGVEVENGSVHPANAVYQPAFHGIYWMDDGYAHVPWPIDWVNYSLQGVYPVLVTLYLAHMRLTTTSVVTSLQPAAGSPIKVVRCGTNDAATTGDLALDLDLNLTEENANLADYQVFKRVQGSKLLKGPVVSKIIAGAGISISNSPGVPQGAGDVTISMSASQSYSGDITDIAFDNAKQELIGMFPYIRLLDWTTGNARNVPTGFVGKFVVPHDLVGSYQVAVYMTIFGESDVAFPVGIVNRKLAGLSFSYSILHDYDPSYDTYGTLLDNLIEPISSRAVEVPFGKTTGLVYNGTTYLYKAYDPMIIHNNPNDTSDDQARIVRCLGPLFPAVGDKKGGVVEPDLTKLAVQGGNLVGVRIQRSNVSVSADEYTGKLGFARLRWQLIRIV